MGYLDANSGSIPGLDYCSLGGEFGVGDVGETLVHDAIFYMYEGSDISHALSLLLSLSIIIVSIFSLVNKNIDKNI